MAITYDKYKNILKYFKLSFSKEVLKIITVLHFISNENEKNYHNYIKLSKFLIFQKKRKKSKSEYHTLRIWFEFWFELLIFLVHFFFNFFKSRKVYVFASYAICFSLVCLMTFI